MFALRAIVTRPLHAELEQRKNRRPPPFVQPHEQECFVERPAPGFEELPGQCVPARFLDPVSLNPTSWKFGLLTEVIGTEGGLCTTNC